MNMTGSIMEKTYLLTNGCSFVWGDELEGHENPPDQEPHTFTYKLADKLGVDYVNLSTCGACNGKIFRDTINFLRKHQNNLPSHIVVIWSAWQRDEVAENHEIGYEETCGIQRWQCMSQISPSRLRPAKPELSQVLDVYYDYMDVTRTGIINTLTYMNTLQLYCDAVGIKLLQGGFHRRMWHNFLETTGLHYTKTEAPWTKWIEHVHGEVDNLRDSCRIGLGRYTDMFTIGGSDEYPHCDIKEHGHPCENTHSEFANLLYDIIIKDE